MKNLEEIRNRELKRVKARAYSYVVRHFDESDANAEEWMRALELKGYFTFEDENTRKDVRKSIEKLFVRKGYDPYF